jgi:gamma-glutamyltranspeptidase / glutathione hydrolase
MSFHAERSRGRASQDRFQRVCSLLLCCAGVVLAGAARAAADTAVEGVVQAQVAEPAAVVQPRPTDRVEQRPVKAVCGFAATVQPLATQAALDAFARGGNAIDAAVAAGLTLGVVDGHNSGIGGGCFILIRLAGGGLVCIDGRETAPAAATRDMFLRDGRPIDALSRTGPLAVGVPGALAAYARAVEQFGRLPPATAFAAGIRHAEQGFPLDRVYARKLANTAVDLARFPASREILLQPDGATWPAGHVLVQRDLAATYRSLAAEGPGWFYRGPFAAQTAAFMRETGGLVTEADFRSYRVVERKPLETRYRDWTIVGFPPPSSGGVHVAQMLNMLATVPPTALEPGTAAFAHRVVETMKLAFADRAHWLGDPAFTAVPAGLASTDYAADLAARIDMSKATPVPRHAEPPAWQSDHFDKHTTHFATADEEGNWVSCTATINTSFGSKLIVPGTGVILNNEMDDFTAAPGTPNAFGLVGGEANAVAPGKRPLSCMSPTIVLDAAGEPVMSIGAAGGPTIISQVLLGLLVSLDHGMTPAQALAAPRLHHQWKPDRVQLEEGAGEELAAELRRRGHEIRVVDSFGAAQLIRRGPDGSLSGASDPRVQGQAAGTPVSPGGSEPQPSP